MKPMILYARHAFAAIAVVAITTACDVDVQDKGKLPEVDVKAGRMPDVDVRGPDIDIKRKEITVPDVDIDVNKKKVEVPTIEITPPKENGG